MSNIRRQGPKAVGSQEIVNIGHKAKRETEAFINHYINDQAKGWPILHRCSSVYTGYRQEKQLRTPDILKTLLTR